MRFTSSNACYSRLCRLCSQCTLSSERPLAPVRSSSARQVTLPQCACPALQTRLAHVCTAGALTGAPAQFARDVARGVLPSWRDIACVRRRQHFEAAERDWQLLRRGRYVEFNMLYDRCANPPPPPPPGARICTSVWRRRPSIVEGQATPLCRRCGQSCNRTCAGLICSGFRKHRPGMHGQVGRRRCAAGSATPARVGAGACALGWTAAGWRA